jgi:predicted Zn-dependent peptidase
MPREAGLRATFDNGLRVLCVENPGTQTTAVAAFINTSARAEAPTLAGVRFFVARALVLCSAAEQPDIADRIQDLGASVASGATLDLSEVTVGVAAEDMAAGTELLRDILFHAQFSEAGLTRLRHQVAVGLATADELPETAAENVAAARLYPNHPFGRPVEGLATTVAALSTERVRAVYRQSCVPNNLVVVITGGAPAEQSLQAARAAFGGLLPGSRLAEAAEGPLALRESSELLHRRSTTGFVHVGGRAPGLAEPGYPAATVALALLGSGMASRLYGALRRNDSVAYTFGAAARAARAGSRAGVWASSPPERLEEAEGRTLLAIRWLATELASPEEILRAKEYIVTSHAITHQRSADLAHQLGALEIASGRGLELDRELPQLVRDVTPEQVRDAARTMFDTRVRVRVLPS